MIICRNNKCRLYSRKTHKRLGTFPSRKVAVRREMQINYFKNINARRSK